MKLGRFTLAAIFLPLATVLAETAPQGLMARTQAQVRQHILTIPNHFCSHALITDTSVKHIWTSRSLQVLVHQSG
jgi:hypothetical protein